MPEAALKKIGDLLRREAPAIARDAASLFLQQLHLDAQTSAAAVEGAPAATSLVPAEGKSDEAEAILADSFERLTGVMALSLLVDEPRLLTEELQWLDRSVSTRFEGVPGATGLERLIDSLSGACRQVLGSDDSDILADWLAQAHAGLNETEPLLTEARINPHFEGSQPHPPQDQ
jgi:hypothetical protein